MNQKYAPHEPLEEVLSAQDAFRDAEQSAARWETVARERHSQPVLIELPEPSSC